MTEAETIVALRKEVKRLKRGLALFRGAFYDDDLEEIKALGEAHAIIKPADSAGTIFRKNQQCLRMRQLANRVQYAIEQSGLPLGGVGEDEA